MSLDKLIKIEPNDKSNKKDQALLDQVTMQYRVVARSIDKADYMTAINYLNLILFESVASEKHAIMKI